MRAQFLIFLKETILNVPRIYLDTHVSIKYKHPSYNSRKLRFWGCQINGYIGLGGLSRKDHQLENFFNDGYPCEKPANSHNFAERKIRVACNHAGKIIIPTFLSGENRKLD